VGERRRALAERIRDYAGLDPPAWLLDARVRERARALGLDEAAYLELAAGGSDEAGRLAELLRVGETRFFRHRAQVAALRAHVIPERASAAAIARRPLRAWSAGCASGEEAWTLAMLLADAAPASGWEVVGTDLADAALERAREGVYAAERATDVPPDVRARWLRPVARGGGAGVLRVADELRSRVTFRRHNLLDARAPGAFDVVLCRNVLIYFDGESRRGALGRLHAALAHGGWLFVGYSETVRDDLRFAGVRVLDAIGWRQSTADARAPAEYALADVRAAAGGEPMPSASPSASPKPIPIPIPKLKPKPEPIPEPEPKPKPKLKPAPVPSAVVTRGEAVAPRLALHGDYTDVTRLQAELRPLIAAQRGTIELDGATFLGDDAARVIARATEAAPALVLRATRPAIVRWLERNGLA
jgi:chemotaxis protein methyltransferase CheR